MSILGRYKFHDPTAKILKADKARGRCGPVTNTEGIVEPVRWEIGRVREVVVRIALKALRHVFRHGHHFGQMVLQSHCLLISKLRERAAALHGGGFGTLPIQILRSL